MTDGREELAVALYVSWMQSSAPGLVFGWEREHPDYQERFRKMADVAIERAKPIVYLTVEQHEMACPIGPDGIVLHLKYEEPSK